MNVHPLLVHFPVALLTIYAIAELLCFRVLQSKPYWFFVKALLVIVGSASAAVAFMSGDEIEDQFQRIAEIARLVEVHAGFALATCIVFGVLAAAYLVQWIQRESIRAQTTKQPIWIGLNTVTKNVLRRLIVVPLALAGLLLVTITGALGGAIAYGPDIDPIVSAIYNVIHALFF